PRIRAALLLAKLGPDAKKAVPALVRALDDKDPFIRDAAASALGRIGPAAKEAAPACINLFARQNRRSATEGTWATNSGAGRTSAARYSGESRRFDFRSLGRSHVLPRPSIAGYAFENRDPYVGIRPNHPFDAPYVLSRIDAKECSALPVLAEVAKQPGHPARL